MDLALNDVRLLNTNMLLQSEIESAILVIMIVDSDVSLLFVVKDELGLL